ncbi:hypothetical protein HYS50_02165 [Candidatus Woesearchaeota archaeon]|nr:hypothetical protein [Candidatus Woesearchaeota archaeon]MBI2025931.1 hypothetical protein [Candidatus Levybacteria bacterium]
MTTTVRLYRVKGGDIYPANEKNFSLTNPAASIADVTDLITPQDDLNNLANKFLMGNSIPLEKFVPTVIEPGRVIWLAVPPDYPHTQMGASGGGLLEEVRIIPFSNYDSAEKRFREIQRELGGDTLHPLGSSLFESFLRRRYFGIEEKHIN